MNKWDRILLGGLVVAYAAGTPGLGLDTRTATPPALLAAGYTTAALLPMLALGASWKWPRAAASFAVLGGAFALALPTLDLAGVLVGPPPAGMIVLNIALVALGLAVLWRRWRAAASVLRPRGA